MPQEALDEGVGIELCDFCTIALLPVAKGEANLIALNIQETMIGNGHAVGIAAQIA